MVKRSKCRTGLISDLPADEDAFGSHDRVADTIADLVRSEPGGRSIGLEGGWGSGKSTVVNLLRKKLEAGSDSSLSFFVFDAWAHQGDPLRRTFLEKLIGSVNETGWPHREKWVRRLQELSRRRRRERSREIPLLTRRGRILGFLLLLLPVGIVTYGAGLQEALPLWATLSLTISGGLIALAPIVYWLSPAATRWLDRRRGRPGTSTSDSEVDALIANRIVTETVTETIEDPNPTSVEFEHAFRGCRLCSISEQPRVQTDPERPKALRQQDRSPPSPVARQVPPSPPRVLLPCLAGCQGR